jgi:hypothetical protein
MSTEFASLTTAPETETEAKSGSTVMRALGWVSIGMAVAALSIYVGYEFRTRYKFNKRTPYDFYSNAGKAQASEFGMGV